MTLGSPHSPASPKENFMETKLHVINFLVDTLNITNIKHGDIDCAHRVGSIKDKKQTILVRFFRREIVDYILRSKKMLKNTSFSMFEDATGINKRLLRELKDRPEVESAWIMGGKVWAKLHGRDRKMKISINDNLDYKLANQPDPSLILEKDTTSPIHPASIISPTHLGSMALNLSSASNHSTPMNLSSSSHHSIPVNVTIPMHKPFPELYTCVL
jgi:hypothetical protein